MSRPGALRSFLRAPGARRRLALEALAELVRARLMTLLPARVYTADLGVLSEAAAAAREGGAEAPGAERAAEIGRMVERVARAMPFRALCLQQAIAVRRMLRRRGLQATVLLGVSRRTAEAAPDTALGALPDSPSARAGAAAHAWVTVGARVISGDTDLADYTVVARFN